MLAALTVLLVLVPPGMTVRMASTRALKETVPTPGTVPVPTTVTTAPGVITTVDVPIATGPSVPLGPAPVPAPGTVKFGLTYSPIVASPIQNTSSREFPGSLYVLKEGARSLSGNFVQARALIARTLDIGRWCLKM